jgi:hypothetical protein
VVDDKQSAFDRLWSSGLAWHVLALTLLVLAFVAVTRPAVARTSDEGVTVLQARLVERTGSWVYDYPLEDIDSEGEARPFPGSAVSSEGVFPYAQHPVYPMVLLVGERAMGVWALPLLSTFGAVGAALSAALIARFLAPRLERPALWVAGIASPLLYDSSLVIAHTLAACAFGFAVLLTLRMLDRGSIRPLAGGALVACLLVAAWLRSEGLIVGLAIAVGIGVAAARLRRIRRVDILLAALVLGASAFAWASERLVVASIVGEPEGVAPRVGGSWLAARIDSFHATWLNPSYNAGEGPDAILWLAVAALAAAVVLVRIAPQRRQAIIALGLVALCGYAYRLIAAPADTIPGILIAFPLAVVGVLLLTSEDLKPWSVSLVATTALVVLVTVTLTQYPDGGSVEWGGRYFAVALPAIVPVVLLPFRRLSGDPALAWARGPAMVGAVVLVVILTGIAVRDFRYSRGLAEELADRVAAASVVAGPEATIDGKTVVVSPGGRLLPQILWGDFDDYQWVVFWNQFLDRYEQRLDDLDVSRVVLVSARSGDAVEQFDDWTEIERTEVGALDVVVLERAQ